MPDSIVEPAAVFRSTLRRACDERAFVLVAVGISSEVGFDDGGYVVWVEASVRERALQQLWLYEQERSQPPPLPVQAPPPRPGGWRGSVAYVLVLLLAPWAMARGWFAGNLYHVGVLDPARIRAGEWWRALTALTLHWNGTHLLGNVAAGALLGISAAQVWGSARAWLLITCAAVVANLTEGWLDLGHYVSAGASTAVFAALGLVAAHAWRTRGERTRTLRDWAPLIAGVALLGMFGAGSQDPQAPLVANTTNVLSHALGFVAGALLGLGVATVRGARWLESIPVWLAAVATPLALMCAWALALGTLK